MNSRSKTKLLYHSKEDLKAGFAVALVALPLALGIANACNFSPLAGIISAICGAVIGTLFGGGAVSIKGPGAGLIGVTLLALNSLGSIEKVLAATLIAGIIISLVGYLKLAKIAEQLPKSVIGGFLAAIGVIILSKELLFGLTGSTSSESAALQVLWSIKDNQIHPLNTLFFVISILLLMFSEALLPTFLKRIPPAIWLVMACLPIVFVVQLWEPQSIQFWGQNYRIGPHLLVDLPQELTANFQFPDFSSIYTWTFWNMAFSIAIIALITSLTCAKAVDKIDLEDRKTNLNKDIVAVGLATLISAALGGLVVITVIVRSSVNIQNGAKSKFSNLFHGIFILLMLIVLSPCIRLIPRAALAAILVYTGFKLAAPSIFKQAFKRGPDQLIILCVTLVVTLVSNQIIGVLVGIATTLIGQFWLLRSMHPSFALRSWFKSGQISLIQQEDSCVLKIKGWVYFMHLNKLDSLLERIPASTKLQIDLHELRLMDNSILGTLEDYLCKSTTILQVDWLGRIDYGSSVIGNGWPSLKNN